MEKTWTAVRPLQDDRKASRSCRRKPSSVTESPDAAGGPTRSSAFNTDR